MKKLLIVLAFLGLGASAVFAIYAFGLGTRSENMATTEEPAPTPGTIDKTEILKSQIKDALVDKHGESAQKLNITVSGTEGDYAKGGASEEGVGGGIWFAAKVDGKWELVWDGNGIITCDDVAPFPSFPSSMIPQCYDEAADSMKTR